MNRIAANRSTSSATILALLCVFVPACSTHTEEHQEEAHRITATSPKLEAVTLTQDFVCQIHSQRHIQVRALERGYLEAVKIKEGQQVKAGEAMFKVIPVLYKTNADAEKAAPSTHNSNTTTPKSCPRRTWSRRMSCYCSRPNWTGPRPTCSRQRRIEFCHRESTFRRHYRSSARATGEPGGGRDDTHDVIRQQRDVGLFQRSGKNLSDNMADAKRRKDLEVELRLADGTMFNHAGTIGAVEADFNNQTGNIPFRRTFQTQNTCCGTVRRVL